MDNSYRHRQTSRDSLYFEMEENLERVYELWRKEEGSLRFSLPILCAAKLEAFINAAGKLKNPHWDILERKLRFEEKCSIVFHSAGLIFDPAVEPNKTVLAIFDIRNSLIHPKMKLGRIHGEKGEGESICREEYDKMRESGDFGQVRHHLRSELTKERVSQLKNASDEFVSEWRSKLFGEFWNDELAAGAYGMIKRQTESPHNKGD